MRVFLLRCVAYMKTHRKNSEFWRITTEEVVP